MAEPFVDQPAAGVGEDGYGAGVDDPGDAQVPGRFQDIAGALHVGLVGLPPVPDSDAIPGCQVEEAVNSAHGSLQGRFVLNVPLVDGHAGGLEVRGGLRVAHQGSHLVPGSDQLPGQATANEPAGARHQVFHEVLPLVSTGVGCLSIIAMTGSDYLWKNGSGVAKEVGQLPALTCRLFGQSTADRWAS